MAKNKFKNLKIGMEVECITNADLLNFISRGGYHSGNRFKDCNNVEVKGWASESDSSISWGKSFNNPVGVEFVSDPFTSRQNFFRGIDRFIDCMSCGGRYELEEVLEINDSCGCHIHLSKGKNKFGFARKVHSSIYERVTKDFFKRIKKSTLPEKVKCAVLKQYYRSYAVKSNFKQFDKDRTSKGSGRRSTEWNFNSEFSGRGLEWRSFNVRDVETWKDFKMLMSIAFKSLEPLFLATSTWQKGNIYKKEVNFSNIKPQEREIKIKTTKRKNRVVKIELVTDGSEEYKSKKKQNDEDVMIIRKLQDREIRVGNSVVNMINSTLEEGTDVQFEHNNQEEER